MKLKSRWIDMAREDRKTPYPISIEGDNKTIITPGQTLTSLQEKISCNITHSSDECIQRMSSIAMDPRKWSKEEVHIWLNTFSQYHKLDIDAAKFNMNGKAICLMTIDMFISRVPGGGKSLYRDFRTRLHRAVYIEDVSMKSSRALETSCPYHSDQSHCLPICLNLTLALRTES